MHNVTMSSSSSTPSTGAPSNELGPKAPRNPRRFNSATTQSSRAMLPAGVRSRRFRSEMCGDWAVRSPTNDMERA